MWSFMCLPVSAPNEAAVCSAMIDGAREALSNYSSTIDEDLALLRDGRLVAGSREEVAVQVRAPLQEQAQQGTPMAACPCHDCGFNLLILRTILLCQFLSYKQRLVGPARTPSV